MKQITLTETQYLSLRQALEQALAQLTEAEIAALDRPTAIDGDADTRRAEARRRLKEGANPRQIMAECGIPETTAYRWAKQARHQG